VDRKGNESPLAAELDQYHIFKISPDGTRVAATIGTSANSDIWILDLNRGNKSRLTFNESTTLSPIWTPDGQRIIYAYLLQKDPGFYLKKADGTGEAEKILAVENVEGSIPFSSSPDGKILAIWDETLTTSQLNISILSMEGDQERTPLLQEKYNESYPQISPDGRWIAFQSDETGRYEVYVRSFPDVNQGRWQVSTNGGDSPLWSPDGRELFYRSGDSFIAVDVETEPAFNPGKSEVLFRGVYYSDSPGYTFWDIHPDGDRFLLIKPPVVTAAEPASQEPAVIGPRKINIILNWFEELKDRVPVD
jgi:serine/threonine-protein kinase